MDIDSIIRRVFDKNPKNSIAVIEEVVRSEFKFLLEHFKSGNHTAVNCIHLGKFKRNRRYDENGVRVRRFDLKKKIDELRGDI